MFHAFTQYILSLIQLLTVSVMPLVYQIPFVPGPCDQPLQYSIGDFDERFHISREDFLQALSEAEAVWEDSTGKELFQYQPESSFSVNLIYDERQERTNAAQDLDKARSNTQEQQQNLNTTQQEIIKKYQNTLEEYERNVQRYQKKVDEYNAEVEYWNKKGGAPQEEYNQLQDEKKDLADDYNDLEKERKVVNDLVKTINTFSKQETQLVESYNAELHDFIDRYGGAQEFDQGVYNGRNITIYQFADHAQLVLVLAHELGHALNMQHVNDPSAIMYYLMEDQDVATITATDADFQELDRVCRFENN